jgi:hypothetical protein
MDSTRVLRAIAADTCCGADYEPARRLTFRSRAGKDVARSYLPSPPELYKTPDMPMARTWRADTTPEHLLVRVLRPGANLSAGPEPKANSPELKANNPVPNLKQTGLQPKARTGLQPKT